MKNEFITELIDKYHSRCRVATKLKIYKRMIGVRGRWKSRYSISLKKIDKLLMDAIGTSCKYCGELIRCDNFSLDHQTPISRGGSKSSVKNLQIVCKRCNTRKGVLNDSEYVELLECIGKFDSYASKYILQKLSSRGFRG